MTQNETSGNDGGTRRARRESIADTAVSSSLSPESKAERDDLLAQLRAANEKLVTAGLRAQEQAEAAEAARAEAQRSASELDAVFASMVEAVFVFDAHGRVVRANPSALATLGFDPIGLDQLDLIHRLSIRHSDGRAAAVEQLPSDQALRGQMVGRARLIVTSADGRELTFLATASPLIGKGSITGAVAVWHDITQQRRTEEALREQRDRAQRYLDVVEVVIVIIGIDERVILINRRGSRTLGYREEEIVGRNWFEAFIPERDREGARRAFRELVAGRVEPVEYYENPIVTASGEERMIAWHNTVLRDDLGRIYATLSAGEDVTERKRAERARDEFINLAAHELKTPLTTLKGYVQILMSRGGHDEEEARLFRVIGAQADRMAHVARTLVDVTQIQGGSLVLRCTRLDLAALVEEVVAEIRPVAPRHELTVSAEKAVLVKGDPNRLRDVLYNLVDNAVKFSPRGGPIQVIVRKERGEEKEEGEAVVSVIDHGIGIPKERQAELFQAFYQVSPMVRPTTGMGLGLYISREIIRRLSGRIWFESEVGRGSAFHFALPLA